MLVEVEAGWSVDIISMCVEAVMRGRFGFSNLLMIGALEAIP